MHRSWGRHVPSEGSGLARVSPAWGGRRQEQSGTYTPAGCTPAQRWAFPSLLPAPGASNWNSEPGTDDLKHERSLGDPNSHLLYLRQYLKVTFYLSQLALDISETSIPLILENWTFINDGCRRLNPDLRLPVGAEEGPADGCLTTPITFNFLFRNSFAKDVQNSVLQLYFYWNNPGIR